MIVSNPLPCRCTKPCESNMASHSERWALCLLPVAKLRFTLSVGITVIPSACISPMVIAPVYVSVYAALRLHKQIWLVSDGAGRHNRLLLAPAGGRQAFREGQVGELCLAVNPVMQQPVAACLYCCCVAVLRHQALSWYE